MEVMQRLKQMTVRWMPKIPHTSYLNFSKQLKKCIVWHSHRAKIRLSCLPAQLDFSFLLAIDCKSLNQLFCQMATAYRVRYFSNLL